MTRYGRFIAVPALSLFLLARLSSAADTPPTAGAVAEAGTHFHRGVELYKDTDYAGAVVEFKRAYDLAPNWRVLYDLGQAYYQLQHYAQALQAFDGYLAQGGAKIPAARRAAVERERVELASRVARLDITVSADGAEVRVDDDSVGTSPLRDPVLVSVGHRKITVALRGHPSVERFVDVAAGDRQKVSIDLPTDAAPSASTSPTASTSATTPTPPDAPPPARTRRPIPWVPWALAGAFAVTTATVGVVTLSAKSDLDASLAAYPGDPNAIDRERTRAKTLAVVDDCLLGATALSAGIAVWLTLGRGDEEGRASTSIGLGPRGILFRGEFR